MEGGKTQLEDEENKQKKKNHLQTHAPGADAGCDAGLAAADVGAGLDDSNEGVVVDDDDVGVDDEGAGFGAAVAGDEASLLLELER